MMKNGILLFILFIICIITVNAQTFCKLKGTVLDVNTNEILEGAHILISPRNTSLITDGKGQFEAIVEPGSYTISISYLGYKDEKFEIDIRSDTFENFRLAPSPLLVEAIEVRSAEKEKNSRSVLPGKIMLTSKEIEKLPTFFGESDIIRAIRLTPGVQSGGEGNSGIYVRGGNAGQNLILLDDNPLYNPSHLLGAFPVFNSDAIENVSFLKGGIPANYGSKIASVIDISLKEGSYDKFSGSGSLGMLSSDITLQTPFHKGKGSVIISGRRMYLDVIRNLSKPFLTPGKSFFESNKYNFYDSNLKISYQITPKNKIFLTAFTGKDYFRVKDEKYFVSNRMNWANTAASLKINHVFNSQAMGSLQTGFTKYDYNFGAFLKNYTLHFFSDILDKYTNLEFIYNPYNQLNIKFGVHYTRHKLVPGRIRIMVDEFDVNWENSYHSDEFSGYLNSDFQILDRLSSSIGLRYTRYRHLGPYTHSILTDNSSENDSILFGPDEIIKTYHAFDPNFMLVYSLNDHSSIKGAISAKHQFIHLASVSAVTLPSDIWLPSTISVKPQKAGIVTLGYFKNFPGFSCESSFEIFYKKLLNQIELKNGPVDHTNNMNIEGNVLSGSGQAYGAELFLKKQFKKASGWLTYTLSKMSYTFQEINNGRPFPAKYDRTHDMTLTFNYQINKNWDVSSVFIYNTGNAMSLPEGRYIVQGNVANHYTSVNGYRMPPYHRLDLSANFKFPVSDFINSSLNFSIYNAYNRANPYYIYFGVEKNLDEFYLNVKPHQISLFPVLPSVTWNFTF